MTPGQTVMRRAVLGQVQVAPASRRPLLHRGKRDAGATTDAQRNDGMTTIEGFLREVSAAAADTGAGACFIVVAGQTMEEVSHAVKKAGL